MIDMQLLVSGMIVAVALAGLAIMLAVRLHAASLTEPGQAPHGGIGRREPWLPQPDAEHTRELVPR